MSVIKTEGLTKFYGKNRGISKVDLSVEKGEIYGFIGPNGAGKSTTIRLLLGLISPTEGKAYINGNLVNDKTLKVEKMSIGYIPSEVSYYDDMTVLKLLEYSASWYKKDCSASIRQLCDYFELDQKRKIHELSYGNKKKIAIIQAMIHKPELIIMDEPTGGLDPLMQNRFFEYIAKERQRGVTVFFSSHILSEVQRMCDRIAIIKEGKIIKVETIGNLKENQYKNIRLELKSPEDFVGIEHIVSSTCIRNENTVSFMYKGSMNNLLNALQKKEILNLSIEDPDLEEIFMHYYRKDVN